MKIDQLEIEIHPNRAVMGHAAAIRAADILRHALRQRGAARIIVASAPSQDELIAGLAKAEDIDWSKVTIFHMDEYVGLPFDHPATFRAYQREHLLATIHPVAFHGIRGEASDSEAECVRYSALLAEDPIDLACMGIGENGHIAFNDPPVADFNDPKLVKVVELDDACRQQQVNDGCFPDFNSVPTHAISLTCPALMSAGAAVCVVPGPRKAAAVRATVRDEITTACPATILRRHPDATLYLDSSSAQLL
jgi:glucosamine-6-phosphate deaminase